MKRGTNPSRRPRVRKMSEKQLSMKEALKLLRSQQGMIKGHMPRVTKEEIWAEMAKELIDLQ